MGAANVILQQALLPLCGLWGAENIYYNNNAFPAQIRGQRLQSSKAPRMDALQRSVMYKKRKSDAGK